MVSFIESSTTAPLSVSILSSFTLRNDSGTSRVIGRLSIPASAVAGRYPASAGFTYPWNVESREIALAKIDSTAASFVPGQKSGHRAGDVGSSTHAQILTALTKPTKSSRFTPTHPS